MVTMLSPLKETLYTEDRFLRYCDRDEYMGAKLGLDIPIGFLQAAERDDLIVPLLVEKIMRKKEDGSEEEVEVRYYSPFQIFLVAALIHNKVDEEGFLRSPDHWDFYKEKGTRYVNWNKSSSLLADHYKSKRKEEPKPMEHNIFTVADDFHNTLRLVHSLKPEERYELIRDKRRMFTGAPVFAYDLDPVRKEKAAYVEQYGIDAKKLKRVVANVGSIALHLDPLERWFSYVRRHPRFRRDSLKGLAGVAQDLYGFCDLGYELVEIAYGEKLPTLLDLVYPDHKPYLMESSEYAGGDDIQAIKAAFDKLKKWIQRNEELLEELRPAIQQEKLDIVVAQLGEQIIDYEKRYGDRYYVGSIRTIKPETKLKLEDLDKEARHWAEEMTRQRIGIDEKRKKITDKEQGEILAHEITHAIEGRLGDLARSIMSISGQIAEATWPLNYKTEREKEMAKVPALKEFGERVPATDPDHTRKYQEFWTKDLKEYEKPYQDKLDRLNFVRAELHGIGSQARLAFCAACRKKPVQLRQSHLDGQITNEVLCDECFDREAKKVMVGTDEDRKNTKYAEWTCDQCGQLLLKFALGNKIAARTQNKVSIQIELDYGHIGMQAKCPNPDCGHLNERPLDWGWIS